MDVVPPRGGFSLAPAVSGSRFLLRSLAARLFRLPVPIRTGHYRCCMGTGTGGTSGLWCGCRIGNWGRCRHHGRSRLHPVTDHINACSHLDNYRSALVRSGAGARCTASRYGGYKCTRTGHPFRSAPARPGTGPRCTASRYGGYRCARSGTRAIYNLRNHSRSRIGVGCRRYRCGVDSRCPCIGSCPC